MVRWKNMICRIFYLQKKVDATTIFNMLGNPNISITNNHSMPAYTYQWEDVYISDIALMKFMPKGQYIIGNTRMQIGSDK